MLTLLQEVAQFPGVKLNWDALVKKTSTGISNAREYQILWRHLAYRHNLLEKLEDGAQPLVCFIVFFSLFFFYKKNLWYMSQYDVNSFVDIGILLVN